jgi:hypothetical protein
MHVQGFNVLGCILAFSGIVAACGEKKTIGHLQ